MTTDSNNDHLQVVRGIAIFLVVIYHYTAGNPVLAESSEGLLLESHAGKIGILIFFILSGYLIAASLERSRSIAHFLAKRIARIWPLYLVACVVIFVFIAVVPPPQTDDFMEQLPTFADLALNAVFLNNLGQSIDGVFWSIIVEVKFYLIIAIVAVFAKEAYATAFAWIAIGLGGLDITLILLGGDPPHLNVALLRPLSAALHGVLIAPYLPLFALGVMLFKKGSATLTIALACMAAIVSAIGIGEDHFNVSDDSKVLMVMAILLATDTLILGSRGFLWLGNHAFSIYLFHQVIGLTAIDRLTPALGLNLAILVTFVAVLLFAKVMSWLAEWRFYRVVASVIEKLLLSTRFGRIAVPGRPAAAA